MRALCALLLVASARQTAAQPPDAAPRNALADRVAVAGELTATFGSADPGFFNYATYGYEPLRNLRVVIDGSVRASRRVEFLAQLRTDGTTQARLAALYVRIRPWPARQIDVQAGRVPTTFGLFGRSGYGGDNPLVGRPLAYGYLTSLRRDALPASPADLLRMRGRGWLSSFPVGNPVAARGLPIVDGDSWDTGVQARLSRGQVEWVGAVTQGSLGSPRLRDDNGGLGLATRLVARPHPGADGRRVGRARRLPVAHPGRRPRRRGGRRSVPAARGRPRRSGRGRPLAGARRDPAQRMGGAAGGRSSRLTVRALAAWVEGRVRVLPGLDLAGRAERLTFSDIAAGAGRQPWEAPVSRVEAGRGGRRR